MFANLFMSSCIFRKEVVKKRSVETDLAARPWTAPDPRQPDLLRDGPLRDLLSFRAGYYLDGATRQRKAIRPSGPSRWQRQIPEQKQARA
jgi:hypothetical protein